MAINNCLYSSNFEVSVEVPNWCVLVMIPVKQRNKPYTNTILHNSPKGEPKWLRASHSHPLELCSIARRWLHLTK